MPAFKVRAGKKISRNTPILPTSAPVALPRALGEVSFEAGPQEGETKVSWANKDGRVLLSWVVHAEDGDVIIDVDNLPVSQNRAAGAPTTPPPPHTQTELLTTLDRMLDKADAMRGLAKRMRHRILGKERKGGERKRPREDAEEEILGDADAPTTQDAPAPKAKPPRVRASRAKKPVAVKVEEEAAAAAATAPREDKAAEADEMQLDAPEEDDVPIIATKPQRHRAQKGPARPVKQKKFAVDVLGEEASQGLHDEGEKPTTAPAEEIDYFEM